MGQRNVLCTHKLDLKSEQNHPHPSHLTYLSNTSNYPNQNIYPNLSTTLSTVASPPNQFPDHYGGHFQYGSHYDNIQYYHPLPNAALGDPYMLASSSSRNVSSQMSSLAADYLPSSVNLRPTGVVMSDYGVINSIGRYSEAKNAEAVPENFYFINEIASSNTSSAGSPASSEQLLLEEPYKYGPYFTQHVYQGNAVYPMPEGPDIIFRSGSNPINFQPVPAYLNGNNYVFQGNLINQSSQPSRIACIEHLDNHLRNGGCPNWNYTNGMAHVIGRSINLGPAETVNMGLQHISSNRSPVFTSHHQHIPNPYEHIPPVQGVQVGSYSHHSRITAPASYPSRNWHSNIYPSSDGIDPISTFTNTFPSMDELLNVPPLYVSSPEIASGNLRVLSEDAVALQFPQFERFEESSDQHRDMRLDIEDMSYEDLLALEEQIGNVNTGLLEESIIKNLKISVQTSQSISSELGHLLPIACESEACIICQVEYEENETIGTLNCSHYYHVDCIKQWLLVKNICPICKRSALADDGIEQ